MTEFDKDSPDPISDKIFTEVPDLFAPIIEESIKINQIQKESTPAVPSEESRGKTVANSNIKPFKISAGATKDGRVKKLPPSDKTREAFDKGRERKSRFDQKTPSRDQPHKSWEGDKREPGMQRRGYHKGEERFRQDEVSHSDKKRKTKWDGEQKKISKSDYDRIADEFLSGQTKQTDSKEVSSAGTSALPSNLPPPPLFPPPRAMFPNIDPYATAYPTFNPSPMMGMPPMTRMPLLPPPPFPMPPPGLPIPPTSLPGPLPPDLPLPPTSLPMPPVSVAMISSQPLCPPPSATEPPEKSSSQEPEDNFSDLDNYVHESTTTDIVDRSHIDNTPKPSIPFFIKQDDVEIFIPEFLADRYPDHPHDGAIKADPEIALYEQIEKEKRAKEPVPESIHSKMGAKPIITLNEEVKPFNPDSYISLKGQVLPIIKPNQKFVLIGECLLFLLR